MEGGGGGTCSCLFLSFDLISMRDVSYLVNGLHFIFISNARICRLLRSSMLFVILARACSITL